nr:MAG TPA: Receptor recognition protein, Long tail, Helical sandwich, Tail fiber [Caudoviricetes sp.]
MDVQYLKYADITLTDGTVLNLTSADLWQNGLSFEDSVSSDSTFDIGSAIVNVLDLSINNFNGEYSGYDFEGAEVVAYVGLELDNETTEKIRICTMTVVEQPEDETVTIDLTCEDNMRKFDRNYSDSKLKYPATRGQIIRDACEVCGVTLQTTSFDRDDYIVQIRPDNEALTFRQVLQWVAQIGCQWLRCDEYGRLCVKWYDTEKTDAQEIDTTYSFTPQHTDVVITGIQVTEYSDSSNEEPESYMVGTQGYVLAISDNKLIRKGDGQTIASMIAEKCVGMIFRPFESQCPTDVALEAGDAITIEDRNGNLYNTYLTTTTLQPGSGQNIACNAKSAAKNSTVRYGQLTQAYVDARKLVKKEQTARERAIQNLEESLSIGSGLFATYVKQEDGSTISYFHDKAKLEDSTNVIKITSEAVGVSNDGGKTYPFGFQLTGTMIAKLLYAEGINADFINAGALTIKDGKGNIIFSVNMDTNSVYINPEYLMIGDVSLSDKIKELDENVAAAKNMTMTLSNEYQAISTDENGNIPGEFPQVQTTAQVMYGTMDVTDDCSYTITESENVTGIWDKSTHTYTVSEVTADNVWVDIKAVYLNALTITRRFNVSKQKSGTPGRTYVLESSTTILKKESENSITPNVVIFSAYYRDGKNTGRTDYAGRFVIEETSDGKTWATVYTSTVDETSVNYYADYVFADSDGVLVADSDGSLIGVRSKDIVGLRCSLYASGGTTNLIDTVKLDVITEVTALTQEDILKLLTNDGEWKGVYRGTDGELYISFSAAMGGLLKLGGKNNGNGVLHIYDTYGRVKATLNYNGLVVYDTPLNPDTTTSQKYSGLLFNGASIKPVDGTTNLIDDDEIIEIDTDGIFYGRYVSDDGSPIFDAEFSILYAYKFDCNDFSCNGGNAKLESVKTDSAEIKDATITNAVITNLKNVVITNSRLEGDVIGSISGTASLKSLKLTNLQSATDGAALIVSSSGMVFKRSSSSKRYKDIGGSIIPSEIEEWYKIEPVWAKYKDGYLAEGDENEGRYLPMFIAEDVEEHFPQAATHVNNQIEDWNYRMMIPAMFAMIKQQKSEIDNLKEDIKELRKIIKEMRGE